jgi:hypothetical protein
VVRRDPLDALIVGQRCDAGSKRLVAALQNALTLQRATHACSQLQHLDLHGDDPGEHHAEDRDPRSPADDAVK